mgnify:CR=1 FL=1
MNHYDPEHAPNAEEWLSLDEQIRIELAEEYHRRARIKLPNLKAHAAFHAIVENQIAENLEPVVRAMSRLTQEGLARHDAVHAIASVVAAHIHDLFNAKVDKQNSQVAYNAAIEKLGARSWKGG